MHCGNMVFKKKTDRGKGAIGRTPGKHRELHKHDNTTYNCDAKRRFCSDGNLHETVTVSPDANSSPRPSLSTTSAYSSMRP